MTGNACSGRKQMIELFLIVMVIITVAKGDYTYLWVIGGIAVLAAIGSLFSKKSGKPAPHEKPRIRIDHPHFAEADDYECTACGRRFAGNRMSCPYCGVRFTGTKENYEEFDEEEDEWNAWDEEEGL